MRMNFFKIFQPIEVYRKKWSFRVRHCILTPFNPFLEQLRRMYRCLGLANLLKPTVAQTLIEVSNVDPHTTRPSTEGQKLELLRRIAKEDATKRELLHRLSDGLWHTTTDLARYARAFNPIVGIVTVGTMLARMQQQLGEDFIEQMVQETGEGVSSWRMDIDWLDVVKEIIRQTATPGKPLPKEPVSKPIETE